MVRVFHWIYCVTPDGTAYNINSALASYPNYDFKYWTNILERNKKKKKIDRYTSILLATFNAYVLCCRQMLQTCVENIRFNSKVRKSKNKQWWLKIGKSFCGLMRFANLFFGLIRFFGFMLTFRGTMACSVFRLYVLRLPAS